jgi:ABC-type Fe3+ transport system substrate-binding protein
MLKSLKPLLLPVIAAASLFIAPAQADWKQQLGELWEQTKAVTSTGVEMTKEGLAKAQDKLNQSLKEPTEIGIAYGTEKRKWLEWAVTEFGKTPEGSKVTIKLIPMGSIEGAEAVLKKDERIHVWSPASSMVEGLLSEKWEKEYGKSPIFSDAILVLTPMVIVMWEERYKAFVDKYTDVNFKTIAEALNERTGWAAIANKPDWGIFTFGHTKPTHSNSGLMTLVLTAYDYHDLFRGVKNKHIMDEGFLTWMEALTEGVNADEESTGKLMKAMLQRGPSSYNAVMVYENLALSNLDTAEGRWGKIKIVYPSRSVWNDNPYYIIDAPWSTEAHKTAAQLFQNFLLSEAAQREARDKYLFRPANVDVPIMGDNSAFDKLKDVVSVDVPSIQRPSGEVLENLINVWKRNQ